jgi:hypothetical protein
MRFPVKRLTLAVARQRKLKAQSRSEQSMAASITAFLRFIAFAIALIPVVNLHARFPSIAGIPYHSSSATVARHPLQD